MCSSLELTPALPLNSLPSPMITLALSNNKLSEIKNGSLVWIKLPQKNTKVCAAAEGHAGIHSPCYSQGSWWWLRSMLPPEAVLMCMICAADGSHVDGCSWSILPLAVIGKEAFVTVVSTTVETH